MEFLPNILIAKFICTFYGETSKMCTIDKIKITVILLLLSFQNLKGQLL